MTELSPAAIAVDNALAACIQLQGEIIRARPLAAAALEAAADQVVPDEPRPELSQFWDDEANREWQNNQQLRRQLLAIAAELKAHA
jgi:hypothetical protein